jgi:hypothetical protein
MDNLLIDSIMVFVNYISNQIKKNENYEPHSIIKALIFAFEKIKEEEKDEIVVAYSDQRSKNEIYEPYCVVLKKVDEDQFELLEIRNLKFDKTMPVDAIVYIFRLQMEIDKYDSKFVSPKESVDILNKIFKKEIFVFLGDRWKEARKNFDNAIKENKLNFNKEIFEKINNEYKKTTKDTPWKDYSPFLRSVVGSFIKENNKIVITSPKDESVNKGKIFDSATNILLNSSFLSNGKLIFK